MHKNLVMQLFNFERIVLFLKISQKKTFVKLSIDCAVFSNRI